ncbi:hypothetical protein PVK06_024032 [Gossypium arboreum]|uniref:Uncharacterized protein n=1 Tax=Gossypium arboreum TaxID=29729 RepID=A0ABR0PCT5_GOSAR|nr:hypothetical protein PVK06_024032 [Gossypium arboreum]
MELHNRLLNGATTNQWSNDNQCEDNKYSYEPLYESYKKDNGIPKHPDEYPCDMHKIPSCETVEPSNFERLSNILDKMEQMRKMLQEISELLSPREEAVYDVPNLYLEEICFNVDYLQLDDNSQQEFGTRDPRDELNMTKPVPDLIDVESGITTDVVADVKVEVTTNMEHKSIRNETGEKSIHFLAIAEKVSSSVIDKFDSFSFDKGNKAQVTKSSRDMEGWKLEPIIPQKMIWGWLKLGTKWLVIWMSRRSKME